jgi:nucleotide-binding universal stress UspA family protein
MKILVPVDGSKVSQAAVSFIASRASLIGTDPQVQLLNVQLPIPVRAARVVGKDVVKTYYTDEAAKALKPAIAALKKAGLTAQTDTRVGHPAEEIAAAADRDGSDLIVMGSHGRGSFTGLVMGSVTNAVLTRTRHPMLVLRDGHGPKGDSLKVGIAVDGSKYGREAVKFVIRHRDLFGAAPQITLLNVVPDFAGAVMPDMAGIALPAFSAEEVESMQLKAFDTAVGPMRRLLEKAGIAAESVRLAGNPGDELAAYAKKKKLDVLVMGSHGYGAFKQAVMGSVATRVTAQCATPVLLIRDA